MGGYCFTNSCMILNMVDTISGIMENHGPISSIGKGETGELILFCDSILHYEAQGYSKE